MKLSGIRFLGFLLVTGMTESGGGQCFDKMVVPLMESHALMELGKLPPLQQSHWHCYLSVLIILLVSNVAIKDAKI